MTEVDPLDAFMAEMQFEVDASSTRPFSSSGKSNADQKSDLTGRGAEILVERNDGDNEGEEEEEEELPVNRTSSFPSKDISTEELLA